MYCTVWHCLIQLSRGANNQREGSPMPRSILSNPLMRFRAHRSSRNRAAALLAYGLGLLGLFLLGPSLLLSMRWIYPIDWDPLASVGESYNGISALLSGAALIAVAASIRYQAVEVKISQMVAVHDTQRELIKIALEEPSLLMCVGATDSDTERQRIYNTLWLRYYELAFVTGNLNPNRLAFVMKNERFVIPSVREHWEKVGEFWRGFAAADFVSIVDDAYREAIQRDSASAATPGQEHEQVDR
jgi:uncharacterized protein DUF6082